MLDPEHILGILMMLAPLESTTYLADEADVIAEGAANEREASALITLVVVMVHSPWGARSDLVCRTSLNASDCLGIFLSRWRESNYTCGISIERRFSYWNTGYCDRLGPLTRRQLRVWRAAMAQQ